MRTIPDPGFAGDDGAPPRRSSPRSPPTTTTPRGTHHATLAVLQDSRVLVPVVAVLGEVEQGADGLAREKDSEMAAVLTTAPDGSTGLLAFTGTAALRAWDPGARPVPVTLRLAAQAAVQQGAAAVVLDLAGPVLFALEGEELPRPPGTGYPAWRRLAAPGTAATATRAWAGVRRGSGGVRRRLGRGRPGCYPWGDRSTGSVRTIRQVEASSHPHRPTQVVGSTVQDERSSHGLIWGLRVSRGGPFASGRRLPAGRGGPATGVARAFDPGGHISTELRINDRIRVPEVRLVGPNGETVGIVPTDQALKLAQEADLDLVEIAPQGRPPVCKLMDYGKFKYENAQKARETRRNQTNVVIKEMKLRPKIDAHDYETKKGHVVRFLKQGDKVKITIMFRGREQHRPELGFRLLQRLAQDVDELGFVESQPKQDGRNMTMVIGPHKKKAEAKAEAKAAKAQRASEREAEEAEERSGRAAPATERKERRRSENLDPDIDV